MRARKPDRLELRLDPLFMQSVDDWMRRHPEVQSRSSAIRHLAEIGLDQDIPVAQPDEGLRPDQLNTENDG